MALKRTRAGSTRKRLRKARQSGQRRHAGDFQRLRAEKLDRFTDAFITEHFGSLTPIPGPVAKERLDQAHDGLFGLLFGLAERLPHDEHPGGWPVNLGMIADATERAAGVVRGPKFDFSEIDLFVLDALATALLRLADELAGEAEEEGS